MWQFFTERGKRVIQLAHHEALQMGHPMVEPEHLLVGLAQEGGGIACRALIELDVSPERLCTHIREIMGRSQPASRPIDLPLSPRMKRALELSMVEARKMGVNYVDTEHILLGVLADESSMVVQHFLTMGITREAVLKQVTAIIEASAVSAGGGQGQNVELLTDRLKRQGRSRTPTLDQLGVDLTADQIGRASCRERV